MGVDDDEQDVQALATFGIFLIRTHLSVDAHVGRLLDDILHLVRRGMPAIATTVNLVLLSPTAMRPLIGKTLHDDLARAILATTTRLELPARIESLESSLKRELVGHRSSQLSHSVPAQPLVSDAMVLKKSRTSESLEHIMRDKTTMVRVALVNKIKLGHFANSFLD